MEETDCFQCQHNSTFEILLLFHAHTWYLTKAMYKTARIGKWLSRRKKNDFHISYLFHFPIPVRFLSLPMVTLKHKWLVTFLLYSLAISLLKCFSFDPLLCGNWLFCSINSLIQTIYDLKVKFILILTTIAIPFPPLFDSKRDSTSHSKLEPGAPPSSISITRMTSLLCKMVHSSVQSAWSLIIW